MNAVLNLQCSEDHRFLSISHIFFITIKKKEQRNHSVVTLKTFSLCLSHTLLSSLLIKTAFLVVLWNVDICLYFFFLLLFQQKQAFSSGH